MNVVAERPSQTAAWWLLALSIALHMLLPANALLAIGIPYEAPFGPAPAKFHPGLYLLVLAWAVALSGAGNPLRGLLAQFAAQRLVATSLVCMVLVFVWVVLRHGTSGAAYIVQTLWAPSIAVFTLAWLPRHRQRQAVVLVMLLVGANAVVALGEAATRQLLFPISAGLVGYEYFRASAFLGHPLVNAQVTAALLPAVTVLPWPNRYRIALAVLMVLSLFAFGGRAAIAAVVIVYGSGGLAWMLFNVVRGRYTYLQLTGGSFALMVGTTVLSIGVYFSGMAERVIKNLVWDDSANVRVRVWEALTYLQGADVWIGIAPVDIDRIAVQMGLDPRFEAIENFWIYLYMQFGAIGYLPFIVGLVCLIAVLWRGATPALRIAVVLYFALASMGNTLSSKTVSLMLLAIVVVGARAFVPAARVRRRVARNPTSMNLHPTGAPP